MGDIIQFPGLAAQPKEVEQEQTDAETRYWAKRNKECCYNCGKSELRKYVDMGHGGTWYECPVCGYSP